MKKSLTNLPELLFLILVALIPVQLGKHFWPDFSQVLGLRIDFLAPKIFLTDLVIIFLILTTFFRVFLTGQIPPKRLSLALGLFLLTLLIAAIFAQSKLQSFWQLLKFFQFAALSLAVANLSFAKIQLNFAKVLVFSAAASVVLAIIQFWQQASLGLWIFGERNFNLSTPGIAKVDLAGAQLLRPYATFPHPNVLAGFLLISTLVIFFSPLPKFKKLLILPVLLFGLFLTFSRSGWLALAISLIVFTLTKFKFKTAAKIITIFLILAIFEAFFFPQNPVFSRFWQLGKSDLHSLTLRAKLAKVSLEMFSTSPLTGVGLGNFLPNLPKYWNYGETIRFLQPVHNVPLLVLAETGIIGLVTFGFLLWSTFKNFLKTGSVFLICLWAAILVITALDHYFWTLQQGQILFWSILGLSWQTRKINK